MSLDESFDDDLMTELTTVIEAPVINSPERGRYYCRACTTYHRDSCHSRQCKCGTFAAAHCIRSHVPAIVAATVPSIACGATARMIAKDTGIKDMNAHRVRSAILNAQRLFGIVIRCETLAATKHGSGPTKHYWSESTVPGQSARMAQLTRLVMRD